MAGTEGDRWGERYLRADLSEEEHDRLVEELRAEPGLLRTLLRETARDDEAASASLLFGETGVDHQEALDDALRRYLLRDETLAWEDVARLEESLAEDERYFDRMLLVETELIEDYMRGALTAEEGRSFHAHFLVTPERREKLRNLRAMAAGSAARPERIVCPAPAPSSVWHSLRAFVRAPNRLKAAVAAAVALLLISGALLWLVRQANRPGPLMAEDPTKPDPQNTNILPSPSPTAEIVSPTPLRPPHDEQPPMPGGGVRPAPNRPARPAPPTVFALVAGALRGGSDVAEKKIEPGSKIVELNLRLDVERAYKDYRVVIRDSDGREVARRARLTPSNRNGLPTVAVALPSALFLPGGYTAALSGGRGGRYDEVGRYSFRVTK